MGKKIYRPSTFNIKAGEVKMNDYQLIPSYLQSSTLKIIEYIAGIKNDKNFSKGKIEDDLASAQDQLVKAYLSLNFISECRSLKYFINEFEKSVIEETLNITNWHQRQASKILGIKPTSLNEKIKKFKLNQKTHEIR